MVGNCLSYSCSSNICPPKKTRILSCFFILYPFLKMKVFVTGFVNICIFSEKQWSLAWAPRTAFVKYWEIALGLHSNKPAAKESEEGGVIWFKYGNNIHRHSSPGTHTHTHLLTWQVTEMVVWKVFNHLPSASEEAYRPINALLVLSALKQNISGLILQLVFFLLRTCNPFLFSHRSSNSSFALCC